MTVFPFARWNHEFLVSRIEQMPLTFSPDICLTGIRHRRGTSPSSKTLQSDVA